MMPAVLRQSGPKFMKDGVLFTPRAMIAQCEVCGFEHAPFGITDEHGKRLYFCSEHVPQESERRG
ncbi:hypothetical protein O9Z70_06335 [Devosia sp. YIM 151766]|uniref:hypothetical protein n=1 Tax=Devosia sp. YIM 151766 TaxID=3017325 RepID=UPI00255D00C9|nr:hypothetical protein [Devosia sp. YIM 151766]WIY54135.1 hypothetical protein O9Z70_06335 [Devosia sp. YIM 151766]